MCGIFGIVGRFSAAGLRNAALTLTHRGPDGFGEYFDSATGVYLAHTRLSIIDLSDAGRQPMTNEDGTVHLTFNGEIYNFRDLRQELVTAGHQFRSLSDSEVIVHGYEQWGCDVVQRLRGIFAFAIWDERRMVLTLARDRLGVKPVYYWIHGNEFAFASEPRAILAVPGIDRSVHVPTALGFLQTSYVTGAQSIWLQIQRLNPAQQLGYDARSHSLQCRTYWRLPEEPQQMRWPDAVAEAESLLHSAIDEQLVSDVPLGVFLSGGIDSSLVSTYAARKSPAINSFCVDFAGWDQSEAADAKIVADRIHTTHNTCIIDRDACRLDSAEAADIFFQTWDEPVGDSAIIPTWHLARLTRRHVTVALSGDGGDELFGGYRWYSAVQPVFRRRIAWMAEKLRRQMGFGRPWPTGCADQHEYYHMLHCPSFSAAELAGLFPDWSLEASRLTAGDFSRRHHRSSDGLIRRWQRVDVATYLPDNNLARVDRASMAHGLEVRVPFLDHRMAEFAFRLPDGYCHKDGVQKPLLRELTKAHLPARIQHKPKQGFSFPLRRVISDDIMKTTIRNGTLVAAGILSPTAFHRWLEEGGPMSSVKLWLLYGFEQWARQFLFARHPAASAA
ncbi:MAG: asparagine synthase (glutamine-hydrolyzing) [Planctomycetaceae bacterium]|nr:asparagine synthase (glutamine-hydrolyzing) [Planctomycetaceae bacterium]